MTARSCSGTPTDGGCCLSKCLLRLTVLTLALTSLAAQVTIDGKANPRIMPLGDSITAGYSLEMGGYRSQLGVRLQAAGYTYTYVGSQRSYNPTGSTVLDHQGHSGWTTPQLTAIVNGSLTNGGTSANLIITTSTPDVVLLMIGTNDMLSSSGTIVADCDTLLSAIYAKNPSVRVIVFPMIYCSVFSDVQTDNVTYGGRNIQFLNGQNVVTDRHPGLVQTITGFQRAGRRITFFDGMNQVVTAVNCHDTAVLNDGVHPTQSTYVAMGDAVVRAIQDVTPGAVAGNFIPTRPSGMTAVANQNGFDLAWTINSLNETGFVVEVTTDPLFANGIITTNVGMGVNHHTVGGLQANTAYYVRVRAINAAGNSVPTFPILATTGTGSTSQVQPPTFSPAAGTYSGPQSVTLSDATSGATIHYTTDGTTPTSSSPTYSAALAVAAMTTITAMATKSGSTDSAVASATFTIETGGGLAGPTSFTANAVASTQINLAWVNPGGGVTALRVERATDAGFSTAVTTELAATADCLKVAKLAPGTTYYFRLRAVQGGSTTSPVTANATTQALMQLVMIGDSITAGWAYARPATINKGIAGDQSTPAADRFFTDVNVHRPRLVTIMIGTNDIANGVSVATIEANITAMVQTATNAGIGVILGTIPPAGNTTIRPTDTITAVNSWIITYAQQNNLTVADYHAALWPYDAANYGDALHPNDTGYGKMAPVLDAAVQIALGKLAAGSHGAAPADLATPGTGEKLTGAAFGGDGNVALAFDGDLTTLYESAVGNNGSGGYVGIDLGAGNARRLSTVRCYPRSDALFTRAFGGRFQGSNTGPNTGYVTLAAITLVPVQGRWEALAVSDTTAYRWLRYYSPTNGLCDVAEIEFLAGGTGTAQVATPALSLASGTYSSSQTVTISTSTAGAAIRFTTDGSTPTSSSPLYTGAITVSTTTTIKVLGQKVGLSDSAVTTATYTIISSTSAPPALPASPSSSSSSCGSGSGFAVFAALALALLHNLGVTRNHHTKLG